MTVLPPPPPVIDLQSGWTGDPVPRVLFDPIPLTHHVQTTV